MVLQIRLSNFFSINEEVILDMQAASLQTKESPLKKWLLFGRGYTN